MVSIVLQIIVCGISTAAICRTLAYYDGPFRIIPRFKQRLLPRLGFTPKVSTFIIKDHHDLMEEFSSIVMADQEDESIREIWKAYHTLYNPKFYLSFRGTLYDLLDCPFCLGPYVSTLMAAITTIYLYITGTLDPYVLVVNLLLVSSGTYGAHFLISKRWESDA